MKSRRLPLKSTQRAPQVAPVFSESATMAEVMDEVRQIRAALAVYRGLVSQLYEQHQGPCTCSSQTIA